MTPPHFQSQFLKRFIALFLSISLILSESILYAGPSLPLPQAGNVSRQVISIPAELGTIEEFHPGTSHQTIVYIQDAHDSLEAQENIAKIITHLVEHQGIKTVYEEGYEGPVPTDQYFGFIEDPAVREKVAYSFMDKLRVSAAEYAHINRKQDFELLGADSIDLHIQNIQQYHEVAKRSEQTSKDLSEIEKYLQTLVSQYFPSELKEWIKLRARFQTGELDFLHYAKRLQALPKAPLQKDFPHLQELLAYARNPSAQAEKAIEAIKATDLFHEIDVLENEVAHSFLKNPRDQEIFQYYKEVQLLKRLNAIEITPDEYRALNFSIDKLNTKALGDFIAAHTRKSLVLSRQWEEGVKHARKFYEIAEARDQVLENTLAKFEGEKAVLVFGGFHKENTKAFFREKNISYYVISPKIKEVNSKHQLLYRKLMSGGVPELKSSSAISSLSPYLHLLAEGQYLERSDKVLAEIRSEARRLDNASRIIKNQVPVLSRAEVRNIFEHVYPKTPEMELLRDGSIYLPTSLPILMMLFEEFRKSVEERAKTSTSPLSFFEIGAGDLRVSFAAALAGMRVTAVEKNQKIIKELTAPAADRIRAMSELTEVRKRLQYEIGDVLTKGREKYWRSADVIYFFYTYPQKLDDARIAEDFERIFSMKMELMKPGAKLILLLTTDPYAEDWDHQSFVFSKPKGWNRSHIPIGEDSSYVLEVYEKLTPPNVASGTAARSEARSRAVGRPQIIEMAGAKWRRYFVGDDKPWVLAVEPFDDVAMKALIKQGQVNLDWLDPSSEPINTATVLAALNEGGPYSFVLGFVNYQFDQAFFEAINSRLQGTPFEALPKGLPLMSTGVSNIKTDFATKNGIQVSNAPGILTQSMLEMNIAALLVGHYQPHNSLFRNVDEAPKGIRLSTFDYAWSLAKRDYLQFHGIEIRDPRFHQKLQPLYQTAAQIVFGELMRRVGKLDEKDSYARSGEWKNTAVGGRAPAHQLLGYDEVVKSKKTLGIVGMRDSHHIAEEIIALAKSLGVDRILYAGYGKRLDGAEKSNVPQILEESDFVIRLPLGASIQKNGKPQTPKEGQIVIDTSELVMVSDKQRALFNPLKGHTLGIVGLGEIGERVAEVASALGMNLLVEQRDAGRDKYQEKKRALDELLAAQGLSPMQFVDREELFKKSYAITLLLSAGPDTAKHLVNKPLLDSAKNLKLLINTGRGFLIDEAALVNALRRDKTLRAVLDVLEGEGTLDSKPIIEWPIFDLPREQVLILGHTGSKEEATRRKMAQVMIKNLQAMLRGEKPANPINDVWENWESGPSHSAPRSETRNEDDDDREAFLAQTKAYNFKGMPYVTKQKFQEDEQVRKTIKKIFSRVGIYQVGKEESESPQDVLSWLESLLSDPKSGIGKIDWIPNVEGSAGRVIVQVHEPGKTIYYFYKQLGNMLYPLNNLKIQPPEKNQNEDQKQVKHELVVSVHSLPDGEYRVLVQAMTYEVGPQGAATGNYGAEFLRLYNLKTGQEIPIDEDDVPFEKIAGKRIYVSSIPEQHFPEVQGLHLIRKNSKNPKTEEVYWYIPNDRVAVLNLKTGTIEYFLNDSELKERKSFYALTHESWKSPGENIRFFLAKEGSFFLKENQDESGVLKRQSSNEWLDELKKDGWIAEYVLWLPNVEGNKGRLILGLVSEEKGRRVYFYKEERPREFQDLKELPNEVVQGEGDLPAMVSIHRLADGEYRALFHERHNDDKRLILYNLTTGERILIDGRQIAFQKPAQKLYQDYEPQEQVGLYEFRKKPEDPESDEIFWRTPQNEIVLNLRTGAVSTRPISRSEARTAIKFINPAVPPSASSQTIGAVVAIFERLIREKYVPQSEAEVFHKFRDWSHELAQADSAVNKKDTFSIASSLVLTQIDQMNKAETTSEGDQLQEAYVKGYQGINRELKKQGAFVRFFLIRRLAYRFAQFLHGLKNPIYRKKQASHDRQILLDLAQATDARLAYLMEQDIFRLWSPEDEHWFWGTSLGRWLLETGDRIKEFFLQVKKMTPAEDVLNQIALASQELEWQDFFIRAGVFLNIYPNTENHLDVEIVLYETPTWDDLLSIEAKQVQGWLLKSHLIYASNKEMAQAKVASFSRRFKTISVNMQLTKAIAENVRAFIARDAKKPNILRYYDHFYASYLRQNTERWGTVTGPEKNDIEVVDAAIAELYQAAFSDIVNDSQKIEDRLFGIFYLHEAYHLLSDALEKRPEPALDEELLARVLEIEAKNPAHLNKVYAALIDRMIEVGTPEIDELALAASQGSSPYLNEPGIAQGAAKILDALFGEDLVVSIADQPDVASRVHALAQNLQKVRLAEITPHEFAQRIRAFRENEFPGIDPANVFKDLRPKPYHRSFLGSFIGEGAYRQTPILPASFRSETRNEELQIDLPIDAVVIVDDDRAARFPIHMIVKDVLEKITDRGIKIVEAEDGAKGEDVIRDLLADGRSVLVITDINMPNQNGIEMIRALRADGYAFPVMMISSDIRQGVKAGLTNVAFRAKPVHAALFETELQKLLARSEVRSGEEVEAEAVEPSAKKSGKTKRVLTEEGKLAALAFMKQVFPARKGAQLKASKSLLRLAGPATNGLILTSDERGKIVLFEVEIKGKKKQISIFLKDYPHSSIRLRYEKDKEGNKWLRAYLNSQKIEDVLVGEFFYDRTDQKFIARNSAEHFRARIVRKAVTPEMTASHPAVRQEDNSAKNYFAFKYAGRTHNLKRGIEGRYEGSADDPETAVIYPMVRTIRNKDEIVAFLDPDETDPAEALGKWKWEKGPGRKNFSFVPQYFLVPGTRVWLYYLLRGKASSGETIKSRRTYFSKLKLDKKGSAIIHQRLHLRLGDLYKGQATQMPSEVLVVNSPDEPNRIDIYEANVDDPERGLFNPKNRRFITSRYYYSKKDPDNFFKPWEIMNERFWKWYQSGEKERPIVFRLGTSPEPRRGGQPTHILNEGKSFKDKPIHFEQKKSDGKLVLVRTINVSFQHKTHRGIEVILLDEDFQPERVLRRGVFAETVENGMSIKRFVWRSPKKKKDLSEKEKQNVRAALVALGFDSFYFEQSLSDLTPRVSSFVSNIERLISEAQDPTERAIEAVFSEFNQLTAQFDEIKEVALSQQIDTPALDQAFDRLSNIAIQFYHYLESRFGIANESGIIPSPGQKLIYYSDQYEGEIEGAEGVSRLQERKTNFRVGSVITFERGLITIAFDDLKDKPEAEDRTEKYDWKAISEHVILLDKKLPAKASSLDLLKGMVIFVDVTEKIDSPENAKALAQELAQLARKGAKIVLYNYQKLPNDSESPLAQVLASFPAGTFERRAGAIEGTLREFAGQLKDHGANLIHYSFPVSSEIGSSVSEAAKVQRSELRSVSTLHSDQLLHVVGEPGSVAHVMANNVEALKLKRSLPEFAELGITYDKGIHYVADEQAAAARILLDRQYYVAFAQAA